MLNEVSDTIRIYIYIYKIKGKATIEHIYNKLKTENLNETKSITIAQQYMHVLFI